MNDYKIKLENGRQDQDNVTKRCFLNWIYVAA